MFPNIFDFSITKATILLEANIRNTSQICYSCKSEMPRFWDQLQKYLMNLLTLVDSSSFFGSSWSLGWYFLLHYRRCSGTQRDWSRQWCSCLGAFGSINQHCIHNFCCEWRKSQGDQPNNDAKVVWNWWSSLLRPRRKQNERWRWTSIWRMDCRRCRSIQDNFATGNHRRAHRLPKFFSLEQFERCELETLAQGCREPLHGIFRKHRGRQNKCGSKPYFEMDWISFSWMGCSCILSDDRYGHSPTGCQIRVDPPAPRIVAWLCSRSR